MADFERIEELCEELGYAAPDWVFPNYKQTQEGGHLSGQLREAAIDVWGHRTGVASEVLTKDEIRLVGLLDDAAEHLDDAHQEWLERKLKDRTRKYIVIGRLEYDENTQVIYTASCAVEAEDMFRKALLEDEDNTYAREVYIDFIFRIPDVDVFVALDDWGIHKEESE